MSESKVQMKKCKNCQEVKSLDHYHKSKTGFYRKCKVCRNEERRKNYKKKSPKIIPDFKKCIECKETFNLDHFYRAGGRHQSRCKACHNRVTAYNATIRKMSKINPMDELDYRQKKLVIDYKGQYSISFLATLMGIPRNKLYSWRRSGYWHRFLESQNSD